jgi:hypothetical protein
MSDIWIIGPKATIVSNGHEYIAQPFLAFRTEAEADQACDLVERVSGERPMKVSAALMAGGLKPAPRAKAPNGSVKDMRAYKTAKQREYRARSPNSQTSGGE